MRTLGKLVVAGFVLFVLLQFVRPSIPSQPPSAEVQAPPEVRQILSKSCYSCHSDRTQLAWFDYIQPGYWLVRKDILTAREHLNFSTLGSLPPDAQKGKLYEAVNMIQLGAMPLPRFLALHPGARVSPEDLNVIKSYLAPWGLLPNQPQAESNAETAPRVSLAAVQPELNGFPFAPDFEQWKPLAFTDRGDNHSFRFILGNDIAVNAARSGNISPWPDGTRFAKIAWQQQLGTDGLIHPGKFIQVELMAKDAQRYQATQGWGWGRWRGLDLKPYGKDAAFVNECTGCHLPMRDDDHVYTQPITAARIARAEVVNNNAASLPSSLPWQPLTWSAITLYVDTNHQRIAVLFGNDIAIQNIHASNTQYPAGAVLALVTWSLRDDSHWFGARIADTPQSVEFVQISLEGRPNLYRSFKGAPLAEDNTSSDAATRTSFIVNLPPARLP
jgi:Haem-binding domain/Cytochrome P460